MYLQDDLLKESVTYQRILNDGGKQEAITIISRLIKKRFGEVSDNLKFKLQNLSVEQLELLGESLFDFNSLDDVNDWLDNH